MTDIKRTGPGSPGWIYRSDDDPKSSFEIYRKRREGKGIVDVLDANEKEGVDVSRYEQSAKTPKLPAEVNIRNTQEEAATAKRGETVVPPRDPELDTLYQNEFNKILMKYVQPNGHPLSTAQRERIRLLQRFPKASLDPSKLDPKLGKAILEEIEKQAVAQTRLENPAKELPEEWLPPKGDEAGNDINNLYTEIFETALANKMEERSLPSATVARLRVAFYHPEVAKKEDLELLNTLGLTQVADTLFDKHEVALPVGWKPSSEEFDSNLNAHFGLEMFSNIDRAFTPKELTQDKKLSTYIQQATEGMEPFDKEEFIDNLSQHAKTLYMYPDAQVPEKELLEPLVKKLQRETLQQITTKFSLPANFPGEVFAPNPILYSTLMQTYFSLGGDRITEELIAGIQPPLSPEDEDALRAALENPSAPVPEHLKALVQQVRSKAVKKVTNRFGIEGASLAEMPAIWTGDQQVKNYVNFCQDNMDIAKQYYIQMRNPSDRVTILSAMKIVGDAINKLQELISVMQIKDSEQAKEISKVHTQAMLSKIEQDKQARIEENNRQREIDAKNADANKCAGIKDIIDNVLFVVSILMVATGACTGLGLLLLAITIADKVMKETGTTIAGMSLSGAITYGVGYLGACAISGSWSPPQELCQLIGAIILIIVCAKMAISQAAKQAVPMTTTRLAPALSKVVQFSSRYAGAINNINQVVTQSNLTGNIIVVGKLSPGDAAILTYVMLGASMLALLGPGILSSLRSKADQLAMLENQIAQATKTISSSKNIAYIISAVITREVCKFQKLLVTDLKNVERLFEGTTGTMQAGSSYMGYTMENIKASIDTITGTIEQLKGEVEGWDATMEDIMDTLRTMIQHALDLSTELSKWSASLAELQVKKYDSIKNIEFII